MPTLRPWFLVVAVAWLSIVVAMFLPINRALWTGMFDGPPVERRPMKAQPPATPVLRAWTNKTLTAPLPRQSAGAGAAAEALPPCEGSDPGVPLAAGFASCR